VRAFRLPIIAAALALSGCMQTTGPVAVGQPGGGLDEMAYGRPYAYGAPPPRSTGAIGALRNAFAAAPPSRYGASTAPVAYTAAPAQRDAVYRLDAGDKLRVVIYGQDGLSNTYTVDAGGTINMPLIGMLSARGRTTSELAAEISAKLRKGYIRDPSVAVQIESYRPFFILGEVAAPGEYPYVPNMTVESAVAIAGGFTPRARHDEVTLTHTGAAGTARYTVPLGTPISPGDTVMVRERWF
jgi:polysaccharide export outer membrane protein